MGPAADAWKIRFPRSDTFSGSTNWHGKQRKKLDADASGCILGLCIYQKINNPTEKCIQVYENITGRVEINPSRAVSAFSVLTRSPIVEKSQVRMIVSCD